MPVPMQMRTSWARASSRSRVVDVVRGHQRDARLPGDASTSSRFTTRLLGDAVVLQLEVEAVRAEELAVVQRARLRASAVLPVEDGRGDVAGQAGAQGDEPLVVALEELVVDARLVVEAFGVPEGGEREEVAVARRVAGEQDEVVVTRALLAARLLQARAGRHVELGADDGLDALLPAFLVEREGAEHVAVVGEGEARHAELLRPADERVDGGGAVEEGEIGMAVQVHERCHASPSLDMDDEPRRARDVREARPAALRMAERPISRS